MPSNPLYSVTQQHSLEIDQNEDFASSADVFRISADEDEEDDEKDGIFVDDGGLTSVRRSRHISWSPSGDTWRDFWYFSGPGWLLSIAYLDPGNYQADIQAGATRGYKLLWTIWWTTLLSIYVQRMCVRLAYYGQVTLAEVQARDYIDIRWFRYMNLFIAELSAILTDLPEVIGIGIAGKMFFGWPYYVGVLLSLVTTMVFLGMLRFGLRRLECLIFAFVGVMSAALFVETSFVGIQWDKLFRGWTIDVMFTEQSDLFAVTGIIGSVVMPHNLYLHTAACQSRRVQRTVDTVQQAVHYCTWEPVFPLFVSFFINAAVVAIAAERVQGADNAEEVGLTDFCDYFRTLKGGCFLWGLALLAAGQSSAITTTFSGQYVMDGFLQIRLPVWSRAVMTRLVAITPCVIVSVLFPSGPALNGIVNVVNSSLSVLLPFALTPLVKYNCSRAYMGEFVANPFERFFMYSLAIGVYLVNAVSLTAPGGGFFGFVFDMEDGDPRRTLWFGVMIAVQTFYGVWNLHCLVSPVRQPMTPLEQERPFVEGEFAPADAVLD